MKLIGRNILVRLHKYEYGYMGEIMNVGEDVNGYDGVKNGDIVYLYGNDHLKVAEDLIIIDAGYVVAIKEENDDKKSTMF